MGNPHSELIASQVHLGSRGSYSINELRRRGGGGSVVYRMCVIAADLGEESQSHIPSCRLPSSVTRVSQLLASQLFPNADYRRDECRAMGLCAQVEDKENIYIN